MSLFEWWARVLFLLLITPFALLATALLSCGAWMVAEREVYAAAVFLVLGGLLTAYVVALLPRILRGQLDE
jgi:hypothetical protein